MVSSTSCRMRQLSWRSNWTSIWTRCWRTWCRQRWRPPKWKWLLEWNRRRAPCLHWWTAAVPSCLGETCSTILMVRMSSTEITWIITRLQLHLVSKSTTLTLQITTPRVWQLPSLTVTRNRTLMTARISKRGLHWSQHSIFSSLGISMGRKEPANLIISRITHRNMQIKVQMVRIKISSG